MLCSFFIDRDGAAFKYIVAYLRNLGQEEKTILPVCRKERAELMQEAAYYMVQRAHMEVASQCASSASELLQMSFALQAGHTLSHEHSSQIPSVGCMC